MKKRLLILTLVVLISLWLVIPAFAAAPAAPVAGCRRGLRMDLLSNNPSASASTDRNGDGYVCVLDRGANTIYIDNFLYRSCRRGWR